MKRRTFRQISLLSLMAMTVLTFQNCAEQSYSIDEQPSLPPVDLSLGGEISPVEPPAPSTLPVLIEQPSQPVPPPVVETPVDTMPSEPPAPINCENQIYNSETKSCEDFKCKTVINLTDAFMNQDDTYVIPERSSEGLCYSLKLMDAISYSDSSLNSEKDMQVTSRRHGTRSSNDSPNWNPYVLGKSQLLVQLANKRTASLVGGFNSELKSFLPIKVDNFSLFAVVPYMAGLNLNPVENPELVPFYSAQGTTDSSVSTSSNNLHVLLGSNAVPLTGNASGGTESIEPIEVSKSMKPDQTYFLDIRALDCGGKRELSDVYLVFR